MGGLTESRTADRVRPRRRTDGGHGWTSMGFPGIGPWRRCAVATAILATVLGMPTPARAVVACSFSGATVQVTLGAAEDEATVVRDGLDIVVRDATSVIPCGNPTVDTVDTIQATDASIGTTGFTIDLSGGMFEPGLSTPEGDGTDEIEFAVNLGGGFPDRLTIVGTGGPDDFLFRSDGIVLNNAQPLDADVEVTASGVEDFAAEGGGGADVLSGEATFPARLVPPGEGGTDTIIGGTAADELAGGDGDDDLVGGTGADDLFGGLGLDVLEGGDGNDELFGGGDADMLDGGIGGDRLDGGGGPEIEMGGGGDDVVDGDAGNDLLEGGAGDDTASFFGAPPVTASLASGSATGDGTDTLSGFENLEGGAHGDALTGHEGANVLTGRGGPDTLAGGAGNDDLVGGDGNDTASFTGSGAPVSVNIGAGTATGEGTDSLVGIENATGGPAGDTLVGNDQ